MTEITFETLSNCIHKFYVEDSREKKDQILLLIKIIKAIGFQNIEEIESCFKLYDHHKIPRILGKTRNGSINKFTDIIYIAVGKRLMVTHPYCVNPIYDNQFWKDYFMNMFKKLEENHIISGKFINTTK